VNGRKARQLRAESRELSDRAKQLIEQAHETYQHELGAARKASYDKQREATRELTAARMRLGRELRDRIAEIRRADQTGIILASRIEA
jgi:hypothetical protein